MQYTSNTYHFSKINNHSIILGLIIIIVASAALVLNHYCYQYPYVNYFPPHAASVFLLLLLMTIGCHLSLGSAAKLSHALSHICLFYIVLSLIAYATIAAQLTPFAPIDIILQKIDLALGYNSISVLNKLVTYPWLYQTLSLAYAFIVPELAILPCFLAFMQQSEVLEQLFFMLLATALIGFSSYYFWPTLAPASIMHSPYFLVSQQATGLKFNQLHHYLPITTTDGGLVAMPSFHIIWAWLSQESLHPWRLLWWLLLPVNLLMIISCVLLGWHYLVDCLGSVLILLLCHWARKLLP